MKYFISNTIELLRSQIFGCVELFFLILTIGFLVDDKINNSMACGIITICFLLFDANNKLYDLKKTK